MTRTKLFAAAIVASAATATTAAADNMLRNSVDKQLDRIGYEANVFSLSDSSIVALYGALNSSETASSQQAKIRAIMTNAPDAVWKDKAGDMYVNVSTEQMRDTLKAYNTANAWEMNIDDLTAVEVGEVYLAVTGTPEGEAKRADVMAIINS